MDKSEEVTGSLTVAGGDTAVMFEFAEVTLDPVPLGIEGKVTGAGGLAVGPGRNDNLRLVLVDIINDLVGIITLIGQDGPNLKSSHEGEGLGVIGTIPGREDKPHRIAERINRRVDLGGYPPFGSPKSFRRLSPPFAPALC